MAVRVCRRLVLSAAGRNEPGFSRRVWGKERLPAVEAWVERPGRRWACRPRNEHGGGGCVRKLLGCRWSAAVLGCPSVWLGSAAQGTLYFAEPVCGGEWETSGYLWQYPHSSNKLGNLSVDSAITLLQVSPRYAVGVLLGLAKSNSTG